MSRIFGTLIAVTGVIATLATSVKAQENTFACTLMMQGGQRTSLLINYNARTVNWNRATSRASISPTTVSWVYSFEFFKYNYSFDRVTGALQQDQYDSRNGRFYGTAHYSCEPTNVRY